VTLMRFDPFRAVRTLPMEALRRENELAVHLDVPGVRRDDVDVRIENNAVMIRVRRVPDRADGEEVIVDERFYGEFTRQLFLGESLDRDGLTADLAYGVLSLRVPIRQDAQSRRVDVDSADGTTDATARDESGTTTAAR
jgi:HSP20 family protein